jgi:probable O-glycosylation ligase (exosortase A-associated)
VRDLILFAVVIAMVPLAASLPYVGVLLWSWFSFMNPHREVYGAAHNFAFNFWIALITLIAWLVSRERKAIFADRTILAMLLFVAWTGLTTATAFDPSWSYPYWEQNAKTFVLAFVVFSLINSKTRIQGLIWVIAVSLGYYAAKGAGFILATGGSFRVFGPEDSMISDNNSLALALVITLPLLNYLRISSSRKIVSSLVALVMAMSVVTIIGTYSRGGFIGLLVVGVLLWMKSRNKVFLFLCGFVLVLSVPFIVPQQWYERMGTIGGYTQDDSFEGRLDSWRVSTNVVIERPLTGGGFGMNLIDKVFAKYNDRSASKDGTAAHSIYFQVLGEHGFVGLALYAAIILMGWLNLTELVRAARQHRNEELLWMTDLASMMQVSVLGFLVVGSLLSMAYYDVLIVVIALTGSLRRLLREVTQSATTDVVPSWRRPLAASMRNEG